MKRYIHPTRLERAEKMDEAFLLLLPGHIRSKIVEENAHLEMANVVVRLGEMMGYRQTRRLDPDGAQMFSDSVGQPPLRLSDVNLVALGTVDTINAISSNTGEITLDLPGTPWSRNLSG